MKNWCGEDTYLGNLNGTFAGEGPVLDDDNRGIGNGFYVKVCSFGCAQDVVDGGWKKIKYYEPFAKAGHDLVRAELKLALGEYVHDEERIVAEWEAAKEPTISRRARVQGDRVMVMAHGMMDRQEPILPGSVPAHRLTLVSSLLAQELSEMGEEGTLVDALEALMDKVEAAQKQAG